MELKERTNQELKMALKVYGINQEIKIHVLTELIHRYVVEREYNLYKLIINRFFSGGYHLGKTPLNVRGDFLLTIRILDIIVRTESSTKDIIPQEHAKYLFALVKEFLLVVQAMIEKREFTGDVKKLKSQLEFFKCIVEKTKEHSDIAVMFENTIHLIERKNPLLLESSEPTEPAESFGTLSLTEPLYKMSKKALAGLVEKLPYYKEDDYYRIVEHICHKYNANEFRFISGREKKRVLGLFPVYFTMMNQPSVKMNGTYFGIAEEFSILNAEELANVIYYPLPVKTIDEFFDYYTQFLQTLLLEGAIQEDEKNYLLYHFLKKNHHHSAKLCRQFLNKTEEFLNQIRDVFVSHEEKTFSEAIQHKYLFNNITELTLKTDILRGGLAFGLVVRDGTVIGEWSGTTLKTQSKNHWYKDEIIPRENTITEEWKVLDYIHRLIQPLKTNADKYGLSISPTLQDSIHFFSEGFFNIEIDSNIDIKGVKLIKTGNTRLSNTFNRMVRYRMENRLLTAEERRILFATDVYAGALDFRKVDEEILIWYLMDSINTGLVSLEDYKHLHRTFELFVFEKKKPSSLIDSIISQIRMVYPSQTAFAMSLVTKKEDESDIDFKTRQQRAVIDFVENILEDEGLKKGKIYL